MSKYFVRSENIGTPLHPIPHAFRPKNRLFIRIEVADSEYQLLFRRRPLISEIFAFYYFLKYARGRPGRRGHVHLGHNFSIQNIFQRF